MSDRREVERLISAIRYQYPLGETTWSTCSNRCGMSARGGRECVSCLQRQLAQIAGESVASLFVSETRAADGTAKHMMEAGKS